MNHEKWNNRDRDTPENIICGIANDGMWFWSLMELQRKKAGHTQRRIAEAMQCDDQVISRRVRDHLKATS